MKRSRTRFEPRRGPLVPGALVGLTLSIAACSSSSSTSEGASADTGAGGASAAGHPTAGGGGNDAGGSQSMAGNGGGTAGSSVAGGGASAQGGAAVGGTGGISAGGANAGNGGVAGHGGSPTGGNGGDSAGGATAGQGGAAAGQGGASLADVCPMGAPPDLSPASPRILVVGPSSMGPELIALHLQGLLAADTAYVAPEVLSQASDTAYGQSLMGYWYSATGRDARLASLDQPLTWVVLLDDVNVGRWFPEIAFEGTRVVACHARAGGAKPISLMTWSDDDTETATRGEVAYRVGNGTGVPVVPAGYGWDKGKTPGTGGQGGAGGQGDTGGQGGSGNQGGNSGQGGGQGEVPVSADQRAAFLAAASLYSAITGKSGVGTPYQPSTFAPGDESSLLAAAAEAVTSQASVVHYDAPFDSAVKLQTVPPGMDVTFMDSGTSSEALWQDRMNEILPVLGFTPHATAIGACNATKTFDDTCLATADQSFAAQQYEILFARGYSVTSSMIASSGNQTALTVQVWDRHYDGIPMDGAAALDAVESRSMFGVSQARNYGLAWTPYHLTFAKLKTARPSVGLTSDGTHATYPVSYALAAMSVISRTSLTIPTAGLDPDTAAAVGFADETIRQLAVLSQWGVYVPDDPATRPQVK